jgi:hypothetical protein
MLTLLILPSLVAPEPLVSSCCVASTLTFDVSSPCAAQGCKCVSQRHGLVDCFGSDSKLWGFVHEASMLQADGLTTLQSATEAALDVG